MSESTPPTLEQSRQLNKALTEKVLDKAQSDSQWRQRLLDDPEAAMQEAGFPETQQLQQMQQVPKPQPEGEVTGQQYYPGPQYYCPWYCAWWTMQWYQPYWSQQYGPYGP